MRVEQLIKNEKNKYAKRFYNQLHDDGYRVVGDSRYTGANYHVKVKCKRNHVYKVAPKDFNSGKRCRLCISSRVEERFYKNIKQRGYKLAEGSFYKKSDSKIDVICPKGHKREMSPYVFNKGHECKICVDDSKFEKERNLFKIRFEKYIKDEGYSLAEDSHYVNSQTPVSIKHSVCGSTYKVRPSAFISHGIRCGKCYGNEKKTHEYISELIKKITNDEYEMLEEYKGMMTPTRMMHKSDRCNNHEWEVRVSAFIHQNTRCPKCAIKRGKAHPTYKPEITDEEREKGRFLNRDLLTKWRKTIFERDDFTCQCCFERGVTLHAHHLNGYHWDRENRYNPVNGITLCEECHTDFHNEYGRRNNTKEQFIEYIKKVIQHT